ncbi:hypothetical protein AD01_0296 [Escherichia coli 2-427-07_S4_C2]|nr:hypothetical protein AD01_0296 [Escherichia coli 2-427-07_S4_C2]PRW50063.1 hypothetical protein CSC07_4412 [Escherichia coli]
MSAGKGVYAASGTNSALIYPSISNTSLYGWLIGKSCTF